MISSLVESLLESIDKVLSEGRISWGAIITALLFFNKINKYKEFRARDKRVELRQQRIESKIDDLMRHSGVESTWNLQEIGSSHEVRPNLKKLYLLSQMATIHLKQRRMSMLKNILKANLSKKLISAIVSMSIASLNYKYHLNIPEEVIWGILGLSLTHISLQTIIDSIKAWAISKADITIRQTAPVIEKVLLDPNTTYKDLFPKVKEVHAGLQKIYDDIKKNDGSQAFKDASQAYLDLHDIFQSIKPPDPIAVIVEDKVAS